VTADLKEVTADLKEVTADLKEVTAHLQISNGPSARWQPEYPAV
jgi:hypothetical protein